MKQNHAEEYDRCKRARRTYGIAAFFTPRRVSCLAFSCGLLLLATQLPAQQTKVENVEQLPSVSPIEVHAIGRMESENDGMYRYQWPGVYFLAAYQGSALYFKVGGGDQDLHVWVDGKTLPPLEKAAPGIYKIENTDTGNHAVRIDVVNEKQDGPKSLGDFSVSAGGRGFSFPANHRQMEFIGDSHTVGFGNTSTTRDCTPDQVWSRTDASHSYGADTALHYQANYQINAISGRGVVRNYGGGAGDPLPVVYPFVLFDKQTKYKDPTWNPSVIVLSLGTNDLSTALHAGEQWKTREELHKAFEQTYLNFLKDLRARNPKALFILWSTNMSNGEIAQESQKVVQMMHKAGDKRVDFVEVSGLSFSACYWHPSVSDDLTISAKLVQDIDKHKEVWQ